MASEILDGETLGQKHKCYNKLMKEFLSRNLSTEIQKIDFGEPDLNNLYKIDMAGTKKNVEYILEVLKCEDMLYVSRALKQSVWLITDEEYAHIINPSYLYSQLLPQMTSRAGQKLLLKIRLNLKNEIRVEEFYNHYEQNKELATALKWLPNCSSLFIENVLEKHDTMINVVNDSTLIKRLCKRSFKCLQICVKKYPQRNLLSECTFWVDNYTEQFLNIIIDQNINCMLNPKSTKIIMKKFPEIILNNFERFCNMIDVPTFVKFLTPEDIENFLIKEIQNEYFKWWFTFYKAKYFICRMPNEDRFDLVKRIGIDEFCNKNSNYQTKRKSRSSRRFVQSSNKHIYQWYIFAPFATAFTDLIQLIRLESDAAARIAMFKVLMTCARQNMQDIQTILKYYREKHINEPFKCKSHFVDIVLNHSMSHRFDEKTWSILDEIFCSMEVYGETENNVQSYLKHIVVYKVINDTKVPNTVEKKLEFDSLKSFQNKLNKEEKDKVFGYLYQYVLAKIQNNTVNTETEFKEFKKEIMNILHLLVDWKKNILDYDIVLKKIRELIQVRANKSWNIDLTDIYNVNKSWRKHMFAESLCLQPNHETCINALKHGPKILYVHLGAVLENKSLTLKKLLSKIRIYWPQTLAKTFENTFLNHLNDKNKHKISVQGLCVLLRQKQLSEIITEYKPKEVKINWSEINELTLSIQKYFAKYMYLARPQPPLELSLLYAKGDYLQYALPSLHSIILNMSVDRSLKHVPALLDTPVSLQKHGIMFAITKLKTDECLKMCLSTWKSNKNASIRAVIFEVCFDLLCKEQNEMTIKEIWFALSTFIDTLTFNENKMIYATLGRANKVPLSIRQAYCVKTYKFLKTLPSKVICYDIITSVIVASLDIMESLDVEFLAEVVFDDTFTRNNSIFTIGNIISACLLVTKSENDQRQRYERIFMPLKYLADLNEKENLHMTETFYKVLELLHTGIRRAVFERNMITPRNLFCNIYGSLKKTLSIEDNYVLLLEWKIASEYMEIFDMYRWEDMSDINIIFLKTAPDFGKLCVDLLRREIKKHFPSIYKLFSEALKQICHNLWFNEEVKLSLSKSIQNHSDFNEGHLLVIEIIPQYVTTDIEKEERSKMYEKLRSHPSAEVRMFFHNTIRE